MAASGSYDYSVTASDLITGAMENIGAIAAGESPTTNETTMCLRTLNLLVKQMMGDSDNDLGVKMWSRKRAYLFLQSGQGSYSLGPSGDHCTQTYVTSTLTVAAAGGASTVTLASVTGMATTYNIGIELDSGSIQWTTINGAPSGLVVTLTATLTGAAASGNRVFVYQTKIAFRPLSILTAVLRDSANDDTPMDPMDLSAYEGISSKTADGSPGNYYYESQLTNGVMYLDAEPDDVTKVIRFVAMSPVDDLDATTDSIAYPQQWYAALEWGLSKRIAPKFGAQWTPAMESTYKEAMGLAQTIDPDTTTMYFQPGIE